MSSVGSKRPLPVYVAYDSRTITRTQLAKLEKELKENAEERKKGVESLKEKLIATKDIQPCLDQDFLLRFLRVSKFDVQKAYDRITNFYTQIEKHPEFFRDCYSAAIATSKYYRQIYISPYRMADNSVLTVMRYGKFHPSKISFEEMFLMTVLALNSILKNQLSQMSGITTLCDMSGLSIQSVLSHTPRRMKIMASFTTSLLPLRMKAAHMVNAPSVFSILYSLGYPFLSKKIQSRIFIHPNGDNWESLHSKISPELLVAEFGGNIPDSALIDPFDNLSVIDEQYRKWFPK